MRLEVFEEVREEVEAAGTSESRSGVAAGEVGFSDGQGWALAGVASSGAQMLDTQGWEGRRTMTSCGRWLGCSTLKSPFGGFSFSAKRKRMSAREYV